MRSKALLRKRENKIFSYDRMFVSLQSKQAGLTNVKLRLLGCHNKNCAKYAHPCTITVAAFAFAALRCVCVCVCVCRALYSNNFAGQNYK